MEQMHVKDLTDSSIREPVKWQSQLELHIEELHRSSISPELHSLPKKKEAF